MQKRNIATALLSFLGLDAMLRKVVPANQGVANRQQHSTRSGRNSAIRKARKDAFNRDLESSLFAKPRENPHSHIGLARKAHMGTVGLPHGRRGLMVRSIEGKLKITH